MTQISPASPSSPSVKLTAFDIPTIRNTAIGMYQTPNEMVPGVEGGYTRHIPSQDQLAIYDAAMRYQHESVPTAVIAGWRPLASRQAPSTRTARRSFGTSTMRHEPLSSNYGMSPSRGSCWRWRILRPQLT